MPASLLAWLHQAVSIRLSNYFHSFDQAPSFSRIGRKRLEPARAFLVRLWLEASRFHSPLDEKDEIRKSRLCG